MNEVLAASIAGSREVRPLTDEHPSPAPSGPAAYFNVLTPEKGTALFERLQREGRILNQEDIGRWPGQICHLQPKHCTPREPEQQVQWMYREFYSLKSILRRLPWPVTQANLASWVVNWHYQGVYATPLRFAIVTPGSVLFAVSLSVALGVVSGWLAAQRLVRQAPLELVGR